MPDYFQGPPPTIFSPSTSSSGGVGTPASPWQLSEGFSSGMGPLGGAAITPGAGPTFGSYSSNMPAAQTQSTQKKKGPTFGAGFWGDVGGLVKSGADRLLNRGGGGPPPVVQAPTDYTPLLLLGGLAVAATVIVMSTNKKKR